jgi:hypothetical protein
LELEFPRNGTEAQALPTTTLLAFHHVQLLSAHAAPRFGCIARCVRSRTRAGPALVRLLRHRLRGDARTCASAHQRTRTQHAFRSNSDAETDYFPQAETRECASFLADPATTAFRFGVNGNGWKSFAIFTGIQSSEGWSRGPKTGDGAVSSAGRLVVTDQLRLNVHQRR